jgi:hypothetical protein
LKQKYFTRKKTFTKNFMDKKMQKIFQTTLWTKRFCRKNPKTLWTKMFCRKFCDKDYVEMLEGHKIHQKNKEQNLFGEQKSFETNFAKKIEAKVFCTQKSFY